MPVVNQSQHPLRAHYTTSQPMSPDTRHFPGVAQPWQTTRDRKWNDVHEFNTLRATTLRLQHLIGTLR